MTAERAVDYGDLSAPVIYYDEAGVFREEVAEVEREFADAATRREEAEAALLDEAVDGALQVPERDRLPASWPKSGPLLDAAASRRVGERLAQDRRELAALQAVGLIPPKEGTP
ncbi:MAG: hypothetical protein WKF65_07720 [Gaiellaceae bacterium]